MESAIITALIIFFLILPPLLSAWYEVWIIAAAAALAMASKFLLAWKKQHLTNPAAVGLVLVSVLFYFFPDLGYFQSTWWIGKPELFIPLLLAGSVVVYKIRKWTPVVTFLSLAFVLFIFEEWRFDGVSSTELAGFWWSGPSLFLAFFMLTEPFTMPPSKRLQIGYGAVTAFLSQTTLFAPFRITPELALVVANALYYPSTLRQKLILPLARIREVATGTFEFSFQKPINLRFRAGQYLEWMLPHTKPDNRGTRRYFTISSAPADPLIQIVVRFGEHMSSFKQALLAMKNGETIIASQLAGDFVLPANTKHPVACIAGGIGVTPFLSQIDHMQVSNVPKHDMVLLYCNNTRSDIAYKDWLQSSAGTMPLRVVHVLAKEKVPGFEHGYLTAEIITRQVPDYASRVWYLSGPPGMVNAYSKLLRELGVSRFSIHRDFFPGLA
jgi:ferredoxin-NADP reductase